MPAPVASGCTHLIVRGSEVPAPVASGCRTRFVGWVRGSEVPAPVASGCTRFVGRRQAQLRDPHFRHSSGSSEFFEFEVPLLRLRGLKGSGTQGLKDFCLYTYIPMPVYL